MRSSAIIILNAVIAYLIWGSANIVDLMTIYFFCLVSYQPVEVGFGIIHHICSDFGKRQLLASVLAEGKIHLDRSRVVK